MLASKGSGQTVQSPGLAVIVVALNARYAFFNHDGDTIMESPFERSLGAFHRDPVSGDLDVDTGGDRNGALTNSAHVTTPRR